VPLIKQTQATRRVPANGANGIVIGHDSGGYPFCGYHHRAVWHTR
jgi:hypothetical protein